MPALRTRRLSRGRIVEQALALAADDPNSPAVDVTGATLGAALGVDRSAIWRHFRDRDDLLQTIADAVLHPVARRLEEHRGGPEEFLRSLIAELITAFVRHPYIGAAMGSRLPVGPSYSAIADLTLGQLEDLGLAEGELLVRYLAFMDLTFAYASMQAQYRLRSADRRADEQEQAVRAFSMLSPESYPRLVRRAAQLGATPDERVTARAADAALAAVLSP